MVSSSFTIAGLSPAGLAALWAANEFTRKIREVNQPFSGEEPFHQALNLRHERDKGSSTGSGSTWIPCAVRSLRKKRRSGTSFSRTVFFMRHKVGAEANGISTPLMFSTMTSLI